MVTQNVLQDVQLTLVLIAILAVPVLLAVLPLPAQFALQLALVHQVAQAVHVLTATPEILVL